MNIEKIKILHKLYFKYFKYFVRFFIFIIYFTKLYFNSEIILD